jgi:hypothetical protein
MIPPVVRVFPGDSARQRGRKHVALSSRVTATTLKGRRATSCVRQGYFLGFSWARRSTASPRRSECAARRDRPARRSASAMRPVYPRGAVRPFNPASLLFFSREASEIGPDRLRYGQGRCARKERILGADHLPQRAFRCARQLRKALDRNLAHGGLIFAGTAGWRPRAS